MEERKEIVRRYVSQGMRVEKAATMAGISKSTYYYKATGNKPGKRATTHTKMTDGSIVPNNVVVAEICRILQQEFMENGYLKVTWTLKDLNYQIGDKKVYRLMKEHNLLNPKKKKAARKYVEHSQPNPSQPFEVIEIDIKYIYIRGERRNAYLITLLDTFSRIAIAWDLQFSIKHTHAKRLIDEFILNYVQDRYPSNTQMQLILRSDNDSRFIASAFREHLHLNFIDQQFIHPATPQQNGHIESFHSVVEELVCSKFDFEDIYEAREVFKRFFDTYNNRRTIKPLLYLPPSVFLKEWDKGNIGLKVEVCKGKKIINNFFFRGQRPYWITAPSEDFLFWQCKIMSENFTFVHH